MSYDYPSLFEFSWLMKIRELHIFDSLAIYLFGAAQYSFMLMVIDLSRNTETIIQAGGLRFDSQNHT